jgi:hypothetical protein
MASEREYPVFSISAGSLPWGIRDPLMRLIEKFEPLDFEAAEKAKAWLETSVSAGKLAFDTHLAFSEDGERLFGFFALDDEEVAVAPEDVPIMVVRKTIADPEAATQQAMKLVWIARSRDSDAGFGNELFDHALVLAWEAGGCALMVEPYDEETEQRLWIDHFHLRKPRTGTTGWNHLWYPLGTPNQDFC